MTTSQSTATSSASFAADSQANPPLQTPNTTYSSDANLLDQYVELQAKIKSLEAQRDEIKQPVIEHLTTATGGKAVVEAPSGGLFNMTVAVRNTYSYSPAVRELEARLKAAKKAEVGEGVATVKLSIYIRVAEIKKAVPDLLGDLPDGLASNDHASTSAIPSVDPAEFYPE